MTVTTDHMETRAVLLAEQPHLPLLVRHSVSAHAAGRVAEESDLRP
jgi:hypothetical protein